jgi:hypothetical protein
MQFPYAEVEFNTDGSVHSATQQQAAVDLVSESAATDVLILAHGWNNDIPAARDLYRALTDSVAAVRGELPAATERTLAVVGALWPAVRWADDGDIAGGGVSQAPPALALAIHIDTAVDDPATAEHLKRLVPDLETSPAARAEFLHALRDRLPAPVDHDDDPPPTTLVQGDPDSVFAAAGGPDTEIFDTSDSLGGGAAIGSDMIGGLPTLDVPTADAGAAGAAGILDVGRGFLHAARNLLNLTTYYTMKDRAGKVGTTGVAGLLDAIASAVPDTRRHLAGHSFGARVVSAAASRHRPVHSVTLLQGAFSHHGFARNYDDKEHDGLFRSVLEPGRLTGPLVVTHTANDKAVGLAYAIASRLAGQVASGLGGPDDLYGGIGRNGALKTPEVFTPATDLLEVGAAYPFTGCGVHNLKADRFISAHSDVTGAQVAYALLCAITAGGTGR